MLRAQTAELVRHDSLQAGVQRVLASGEAVCVYEVVCEYEVMCVYGLPGEAECEDSTSRDDSTSFSPLVFPLYLSLCHYFRLPLSLPPLLQLVRLHLLPFPLSVLE